MLGRFAQGTQIALRAGAAPLLLGARLAGRRRQSGPTGVPAARSGLAMTSKVALDEFFLATELVSATFVSLRDRHRVRAELDDALALYEERGWLADPRTFHLRPPPVQDAQIDRGRTTWLAHRHLRFESGYEPHAGEPGRERWLSYEANRTAHAWLLRHRGRPRPWLVCIPGYRMGHPLVDFTGFKARWLHHELGLNVAIPVMPLHGPRRVGRRGGDGFFTGDFIDTVHAQAQAIWDTRRLITWLQDEGAPAVGAYGVSLGGYTTALLAALEPNLDCVIAGIPATDYPRLLREHAPKFLLSAAEWSGLSLDRIEQLLRVVSPLAIEPLVPFERRYLYAGTGDRLASPDHAQDLWHHWGRPRVSWYQGSHVSFVWEAEVKALLHEAFRDSGLVSR